jgi:prepilin-type N-terminal cleavage/methylation domain-containing protein
MKNLFFKAFTLIELLVVIAIIGILSGLIVVSMSGVTQKATIAKAQVFSNSLKNSIMLDLVSEWKLEGNVNDSWGINSSGSIIGATTLNSGCVRDSCLSFDGDDYVTMGSDSSLNFSGDYTIEMFVYNGANTVSYPTLFNRAAQSGANGFFWVFTQGADEVNIRGQYADGTQAQNYYFYDVLPKNKWTHLVFTFTNSTKLLKLYVNGDASPSPVTLTGALPVDDGDLYFGTYQITSSGFFKGRLDEIRWYDVAVPAYIVKEHYYSALNRMFANGEITKEEYNNFVSQKDNTYGKY